MNVTEQYVRNRFFHVYLAQEVLEPYRKVPVKTFGPGPAPKSVIENIAEHLTLNRESHCWEWTGSCQNGVPKATVRVSADHPARRTVRVPVLMWEMWLGKLPEGARVYSLCDNDRCVNPNHLAANLPTGSILAGILPYLPDWDALVEKACRDHGIPMAKDDTAPSCCCASHRVSGRVPA